MLRIARGTLESYVRTKQAPPISTQVFNLTPALIEDRGIFVTLKKDGHLRGCIGNIFGYAPIFQGALSNTINASSFDNRFHPVTTEELKSIDIEISVLTYPTQVTAIEEIILGKHGIVLTKDMYQSVFLPQVAPEQGWTLEQTLTELSLKAGLPWDAWKQKETKFQVFEAEIFGEKERLND